MDLHIYTYIYVYYVYIVFDPVWAGHIAHMNLREDALPYKYIIGERGYMFIYIYVYIHIYVYRAFVFIRIP
jgi:hypothetical protein